MFLPSNLTIVLFAAFCSQFSSACVEPAAKPLSQNQSLRESPDGVTVVHMRILSIPGRNCSLATVSQFILLAIS